MNQKKKLPLKNEVPFAFPAKKYGIGKWSFDINSSIYRLDNGFQQLFGTVGKESVDLDMFVSLIKADDKKQFAEQFAEGISEGEVNLVVGAAEFPDKLIHFFGQSHFDQFGKVSTIEGFAVEIPHSEIENLNYNRAEVEKILPGNIKNKPVIAREERFRSLILEAPVATCLLVGTDMIIEVANVIMINYWGKDNSIIGQPLLQAVPELKGEALIDILKGIYITGTTHVSGNLPTRLEVNGRISTFYFDCTYKPLFDEDGNVYAIMGMIVDVTKQSMYLNELQASQEQFHSIIATAPVAMGVFLGRELVIDVPNDAFIKIIGKGPDIKGRRLKELLPELESQDFLKLLDHVYTTGIAFQSSESPLDIVRETGVERGYYNISFTPLRDATGQVFGILDISIDVTESVLAGHKVERAQAILESVVEMAEIGTWKADLLTGLVDMSSRLLGWYGLDAQASVHFQTITSLIEPDDLNRLVDLFTHPENPGSSPLYSIEYRIKSAQGIVRILRDQGQVFYDGAGVPVSVNGSVQDITHTAHDKLRLEEQVNQRTHELKDSLADLERSNTNLLQFAYVASHDLQEPLRKIQTFSDLLRKRYAAELGKGIEHLDRIQDAASRMSSLIRDLLDFSGISTRQETSATVDLNFVVQNILLDLEVAIDEAKAMLIVEQLPSIKGDPVQIGQLFSNLISNAVKFRKPDGNVVIKIQSTWINNADLSVDVKPVRQSEKYCCIMITDNGIGFDPQFTDRIFQVFQRLHSRSEFAGTGIGLAICEKVAANHGGALVAHSTPGKGSVFSVYFPA